MVLLPNPITFSVGKLQALILKTLGITFLAFGLSFVLMQPFSFSAASLLSSADGNDFTINDFYNKVADSRHVTTLDSNIVIVDIAACDREGIAEIIETVSLCSPRTVGLDVVFAEPKEHDSRLIEAIKNCPNLVLAVSVEADSAAKTFHIDESSYFTPELENVELAAINFPTGSSNRTIREFKPDYMTAVGKRIPSFALATSRKQSGEIVDSFMKRGNDLEFITYYSRIFKTISPEELADRAEELIDKIVLIGAANDPYDLHVTPVSAAMSGINIHAYTVATILSGRYFYQLHRYTNWAIAFISCFIVIMISLMINIGVKGLIMRIVQVTLLYLTIRLGYYFFIEHNIIINFSYSLMMLTFGLFAGDIWIGMTTIITWIYNKINHIRESRTENIYTQ